MLFPYRDLPSNNQKTANLVYRDDTTWTEWGSLRPGLLPAPTPDLCIAFKSHVFTELELERMSCPYILPSGGYWPSMTLEVKVSGQTKAAERQNGNNIISMLEKDYGLLKANGKQLQMQRRIRFISTTHDSDMQKYTAWFYVLDSKDKPKWYPCFLHTENFEDPYNRGFQAARRCNLNLCEYVSDVVFKDLRENLAGLPESQGSMQGNVAEIATSEHSTQSLSKRPKHG